MIYGWKGIKYIFLMMYPITKMDEHISSESILKLRLLRCFLVTNWSCSPMTGSLTLAIQEKSGSCNIWLKI